MRYGAARGIADPIRVKQSAREQIAIERGLRAAEIEACTLDAVVAAAVAVVETVQPETRPVEVLRRLLLAFLDEEDLPMTLREEASCESRSKYCEFPDVDDGFERSAMVHEAMGDHALAASFYRRAHAFASDPVRRAGYDKEAIDDLRLRAEHNEQLAGVR